MKKTLLIVLAVLMAQLSFACTASFSPSAYPSGSLLLQYYFGNTSSYGTIPSGYHKVTIYRFGDGVNQTVTGASSYAMHNYATPGTYTAKIVIKIVDSVGGTIYCADSTTSSITVSYPPCADSIYASYGTGGSVTFTAVNPAGTTGISRYWSFGDASTGTGTPVTHTYAYNGTYTVYLQDTNSTVPCTYFNSIVINITSASWHCSLDTPRFTTSGTGSSIAFYSSTRPPSGVTMKYRWDFGDGSGLYTTSTYYTTHTYTTAGTYTAKLTTLWTDSLGTSIYCSDSITHSVTSTGVSCAGDTARFYTSGSGLTWTFYSTTHAPTGTSILYKWNFGDGSAVYTTSYYAASHTYSSAGTYTVKLVTQYYDSLTSTILCKDSITHSITATVPLSLISGYIYKDSAYTPTIAYYKVWLIQYDSITYAISTIDSTVDTGSAYTYYHFTGVPTGKYLVKAAITNGPTSGTGYVPTYYYSSASWSTATYVNCTGGSMTGVNIVMQHGTVTGGPGFIAGDVRYGAGKGTAVGDPVKGLLVMVQDGSGNLVSSVYTDAAGHYSITGLPLGTYTIYPEALGYNTTAWPSVSLNAVKVGVSNINFKQTSTAIKPDVTGISNVPVNTQSFTVYPNPSYGKITVQWDNSITGTATIEINNITGQHVYTATKTLDASGRTELNLSQLGAGIYFINITSGNAHYYQKLVMQQ